MQLRLTSISTNDLVSDKPQSLDARTSRLRPRETGESSTTTCLPGHPWDICKTDEKFLGNSPLSEYIQSSARAYSTKLLIAVKMYQYLIFQRRSQGVGQSRQLPPSRGNWTATKILLDQ